MRKIYTTLVFCLVVCCQFKAFALISTPAVSSPSSNATVYGSSVSLYWNKNNNVKVADYFVKVVDLTTLTVPYNYISVGDLSSFEAQNLIVGHTYSWLIRAVSRADVNDMVETGFSNFTISNTNPPTLSITSISNNVFCGSNRTLTVNYSRSGSFNTGLIYYGGNYYSGNLFIEFSDKNGDFTNPIILTGNSVTSSAGSLSLVLPDNLPFGQNYKIRLISYGSIVTSNTSVSMTIGTLSSLAILNRFDDYISSSSLTTLLSKLF